MSPVHADLLPRLIYMQPRQENTMSEPTSVTGAEPVTTDQPTASTPEPVIKAAVVGGGIATVAVAVIGVLVSIGKLTDEQAQALNYTIGYVSNNIPVWGGLLVGLFTAFGGAAAAGATALVGRRKVTPVREAPVRYLSDGTVR